MKTVSIDFDGVLTDGISDSVSQEAREFLSELYRKGYEIHIHSCKDREQIQAALKGLGFIKSISNVKHPSLAYIDDRAIRFNGDFSSTVQELDSFQAWWEKKLLLFGDSVSNTKDLRAAASRALEYLRSVEFPVALGIVSDLEQALDGREVD